jgi:uncharacterized metal-binding protein
MQCALCKNKECLKGKNCSVIKSGLEYRGAELKSLQVAAWLEAGPQKKTKLEEIAIYAKKLGYQKIGIAFCIEYEREAKLVYEVLSKYFEVFSVCCKVCGFEKAKFGLRKSEQYDKCESCKGREGSPEASGFEAACNPIGQALLLNDDRTDLNIMLELKTGYDILFSTHSEAPSIALSLRDLPAFDSIIDSIQ